MTWSIVISATPSSAKAWEHFGRVWPGFHSPYAAADFARRNHITGYHIVPVRS